MGSAPELRLLRQRHRAAVGGCRRVRDDSVADNDVLSPPRNLWRPSGWRCQCGHSPSGRAQTAAVGAAGRRRLGRRRQGRTAVALAASRCVHIRQCAGAAGSRGQGRVGVAPVCHDGCGWPQRARPAVAGASGRGGCGQPPRARPAGASQGCRGGRSGLLRARRRERVATFRMTPRAGVAVDCRGCRGRLRRERPAGGLGAGRHREHGPQAVAVRMAGYANATRRDRCGLLRRARPAPAGSDLGAGRAQSRHVRPADGCGRLAGAGAGSRGGRSVSVGMGAADCGEGGRPSARAPSAGECAAARAGACGMRGDSAL
ncbi:hypothetical protein I4F81_010667 [Pyropia yezoensis]|uniref:Uncharacterized protein n=1 Tax=Pyropia yezoensis TaxID=2788 RepID=A0ACC3CEC2_PYRYE|nr:hypothetical protein I4F81_010667 [Neopyropia yezoensis]